MTIISKVRIPGKNEQHLDYDEFCEKAFSEAGLDIDDTLIINVNDCSQEVYQACVEAGIEAFTLTGMVPEWANGGNIQNWSALQSAPAPAPSMPSENLSAAPQVPVPPVPAPAPYMPQAQQQVVQQEQQPAQQRTVDPLINAEIDSLLGASGYDDDPNGPKKDAKVYVFGSSKGGTGKTFTAVMSTYRYAKTHPHQRIALVDFDIIDGQVGISIHKVKPTIRKYLTEYQKGYRDFQTMHQFAVHAKDTFPQNVDFYLAPTSNNAIKDDNFWLNVIQNCIENYDVVVFDTGIDYINIKPISYVYKCADKILLITTTSIKSVNSVTKQIGRLIGELPSKDANDRNVYTAEDDIKPRLNIVITQMMPTNEMNKTIYKKLSENANVVATFGVITDSVSRAEFFGEWNVFDSNVGVNKAFDDIMK